MYAKPGPAHMPAAVLPLLLLPLLLPCGSIGGGPGIDDELALVQRRLGTSQMPFDNLPPQVGVAVASSDLDMNFEAAHNEFLLPANRTITKITQSPLDSLHGQVLMIADYACYKIIVGVSIERDTGSHTQAECETEHFNGDELLGTRGGADSPGGVQNYNSGNACPGPPTASGVSTATLQAVVDPTYSSTMFTLDGYKTSFCDYVFTLTVGPAWTSYGNPGSGGGDPHMVNLRGKRFEVRRPGIHTLFVVPRGAPREKAELNVRANVTTLDGHMACPKFPPLYMTRFELDGSWLGAFRSLEFSTGTNSFNSSKTFGLSVNGSGNISVWEFVRLMPPGLAEVTMPTPKPHRNPHKHVDTMQIRLRLGPSILTVGWAHTRSSRSNWLWLAASGLAGLQVGGILGDDDITWATTRPDVCGESSGQP